MTEEIDITARAVGVVGLRAVGRAITARLLDLGVAVMVYDANPKRGWLQPSGSARARPTYRLSSPSSWIVVCVDASTHRRRAPGSPPLPTRGWPVSASAAST